MKKIYILLSVIFFFLSGCSKYDKPVVDRLEIERETGFYDELTKEQIEHLDKMCNFGMGGESLKITINEMTYEELNMALMFTGLELYNKPVEASYKGVTYSYRDWVDSSQYGKYYKDIKCTTDRKITVEEAYAIADKGNDIRPEDFLKYSFEMYDISDNKNEFWIPVEGYDGLKIKFKVEEYEDGTAHMTTPHMGRFSLFYERERFEAFAYQEPKGTDEGKMIVVVNCGTLSNISLVLWIENHTDQEYALDNSYVLYKLDENKEYKEYKSYESENIEIIGTGMYDSLRSALTVKYATRENPIPPGDYKLEFGKDKEGYVYKEIEFTIE